jgi:hypothetical protein
MEKFENNADFTVPRQEFTEALKAVRPGFVASDAAPPLPDPWPSQQIHNYGPR